MSSNHRLVWFVENRNPSQLVLSPALPHHTSSLSTSPWLKPAPVAAATSLRLLIVTRLADTVHSAAGEALQSGQSFFVDATSEEEALAQPGLAVAVNGRGEVCGVLKVGRTTMDAATLHEMLQVSQQLATQLHAAVDAHVASQ